MSDFSNYKDRYEHLRMERRDGILQVALHSQGRPYVHTARGHRELPHAFWDISADRDNRIVILTGTGDSFCAAGDWSTFQPMSDPEAGYQTIWEGTRLLTALLDIDVPVIGVANGPAHVHSELLLLSDILVAADHATFRDHHLDLGVVPGDGNHVVWCNVLGENRGRYFLLTGQILSADEALRLGVVNEVLPADLVLPRAWDLAEQLNTKPALTLRYTRLALTVRLKRLIHEGLSYGLSVEALSAAGRPSRAGRMEPPRDPTEATGDATVT